jgi:hypothetical protein
VIESGFHAGLDDRLRTRYYKWWRKYLILKYAYRIAFGLPLVDWILQLRYHDLKYLQGPLWLAACGLVLSFGLLDCPRCGERFYTASSRNECRNCGLRLTELSSIGEPRPS